MTGKEHPVPHPFMGRWSDILRKTNPELSAAERANLAAYLDHFVKEAKLDGFEIAAIKVEDGQVQVRVADYREQDRR